MSATRDPEKLAKRRERDAIVREIASRLLKEHPDWTWVRVANEARRLAGERP